MAVSAFDLFSIGIGPSSSHTVGPMRAARRFVERLDADRLLDRTVDMWADVVGIPMEEAPTPRKSGRRK